MTDNKELKILLISPLPPPLGGIALWTKRFLEWGQKNGINASIVDTSVINSRKNNITAKRVLIHEIKRTLIILRNLLKNLEEFQPKIAHINTSCSLFGLVRDYLIATVLKYKKVKILINYRCNIQDQLGEGIGRKYILKKFSKFGDINLVLNKQSQNFLRECGGINIKILPLFVEDEIILGGNKTISPKIKNIVFTGHLRKEKGIYEIFQVAKKFPDINFNLIGKASEEIRSLNLEKNIKFYSEMDKKELISKLDEADIFLHPSYTEGFSNSLLEAMARGIPIIATNVGAAEDMIENKGGILVKRKNSNEIIDAIHKLEDEKIRKFCSEWNLEKIKNKYNSNKIMGELITIYREISNN